MADYTFENTMPFNEVDAIQINGRTTTMALMVNTRYHDPFPTADLNFFDLKKLWGLTSATDILSIMHSLFYNFELDKSQY